MSDQDWHHRHEAALYRPLTSREKALVDMQHAVERLIERPYYDPDDPVQRGYVLSILSAFIGLLSYGTDRLHPSLMEDWARNAAGRAGLTSDDEF